MDVERASDGALGASPGSAPAPLVVRARGLVHAYREHDRERVVLDGADLDLARGELVALVGPSGSGKSTLINLLAGLDRPRAGTIELEGMCVSSLDERARTLVRRRRIGLVFQFFNLIPTLTVAENVLFPLELDGRVAPAARARALGWLARVGLADRGNSPPDRLSGGGQQRVAIARALATDPPIVLADEPTGNLDAATGAEVLALLAGLAADEGKALLMATHSTEAARIAHRVLRLAGGRLVDATPPLRGDPQPA